MSLFLFLKLFALEDDGVCFVKCDVTDKEDWPQLWDYAEKFLDGPIDILINNAGLFPQVPKFSVRLYLTLTKKYIYLD